MHGMKSPFVSNSMFWSIMSTTCIFPFELGVECRISKFRHFSWISGMIYGTVFLLSFVALWILPYDMPSEEDYDRNFRISTTDITVRYCYGLTTFLWGFLTLVYFKKGEKDFKSLMEKAQLSEGESKLFGSHLKKNISQISLYFILIAVVYLFFSYIVSEIIFDMDAVWLRVLFTLTYSINNMLFILQPNIIVAHFFGITMIKALNLQINRWINYTKTECKNSKIESFIRDKLSSILFEGNQLLKLVEETNKSLGPLYFIESSYNFLCVSFSLYMCSSIIFVGNVNSLGVLYCISHILIILSFFHRSNCLNTIGEDIRSTLKSASTEMNFFLICPRVHLSEKNSFKSQILINRLRSPKYFCKSCYVEIHNSSEFSIFMNILAYSIIFLQFKYSETTLKPISSI